MADFLRAQFRQHPEMTPHIMLYLFEHIAPRVEVFSLNQKIETQEKTTCQMEKTCRELCLRVDLLTEKANYLGEK